LPEGFEVAASATMDEIAAKESLETAAVGVHRLALSIQRT
jgi:hypothetical protein